VLEKLKGMEQNQQEEHNANQIWKGLEQFKTKKKSKK
jgi:hypothetical protein